MKIIPRPARSGIGHAFRSDRKWFKKNPNRTWRIRPLMAGEELNLHNPPPAGLTPWTVVKRLVSGAFVRFFYAVPSDLVPYDSDWNIAAIYGAWSAQGGDFCIADVDPQSPLADRIRALGRKMAGAADAELTEAVGRLIGGISVAEVLA